MKHLKKYENMEEEWDEMEYSDELNFTKKGHKKRVKLNCGIECDYWKGRNGYESLTISLHDLYQGYGKDNNFNLLMELFKELKEKGFEGDGIHMEMGYYDSVDDLLLNVSRKK